MEANVWDPTRVTALQDGKAYSARIVSLTDIMLFFFFYFESFWWFSEIAMRHIVSLNTATCKHKCQNGGKCVLPNFCQCRSGYIGSTCAARVSWLSTSSSLFFGLLLQILYEHGAYWKSKLWISRPDDERRKNIWGGSFRDNVCVWPITHFSHQYWKMCVCEKERVCVLKFL